MRDSVVSKLIETNAECIYQSRYLMAGIRVRIRLSRVLKELECRSTSRAVEVRYGVVNLAWREPDAGKVGEEIGRERDRRAPAKRASVVRS